MSELLGTVIIVDDDASIRTSLSRLLRSAGIVHLTYPSAEAYLAAPAFEGVACLIVDLRMGGLSGLDLQRRLAERGSVLPIIFLTAHGDIATSVRAMKRGAVDFLTKPVDDEVLLTTVEQALAACAGRLSSRRIEAEIRARLATLTPREFEVMREVIAGRLNKVTAAHLGISEKTVKIHRGQVMHKMGLVSVVELARECARVGVDPAVEQ